VGSEADGNGRLDGSPQAPEVFRQVLLLEIGVHGLHAAPDVDAHC
jgi:hypothetical protein